MSKDMQHEVVDVKEIALKYIPFLYDYRHLKLTNDEETLQKYQLSRADEAILWLTVELDPIMQAGLDGAYFAYKDFPHPTANLNEIYDAAMIWARSEAA